MIIETRRITTNMGIAGGEPIISGTRIPVSTIASYYLGGYTVAQLNEFYPHLSVEDIAAAITYFDTHRDEIHDLIADNEARA